MLARNRLRGQYNRRSSKGRKGLFYLGKMKELVLFNSYVMKTRTALGLALCKALPSNRMPAMQHSQVRTHQADAEATSIVSAWPLRCWKHAVCTRTGYVQLVPNQGLLALPGLLAQLGGTQGKFHWGD